MTAYVAGIGLWTPGFASASAWRAGTTDSALIEPAATLLPPRLARRSGLLTRMLVDVFSQAAGSANPALLPSVFGTTYGELETMLALLRMLWTDGELSPTRFHNSVYNTASGYLSISAANQQFTTTVTAGGDTVAMALLEGLAFLRDRGGSVVVAVGDEAARSTFLPVVTSSLAVALLLTAERPSECLGVLGELRHRSSRPAEIPEAHRLNPTAMALPLIGALLSGEFGVIPLSNEPDGWGIELTC